MSLFFSLLFPHTLSFLLSADILKSIQEKKKNVQKRQKNFLNEKKKINEEKNDVQIECFNLTAVTKCILATVGNVKKTVFILVFSIDLAHC